MRFQNITITISAGALVYIVYCATEQILKGIVVCVCVHA